MNLIVRLVHICFNGPLLIYVGLIKPKYIWIYHILLGVGVILFTIFMYKLVQQVIIRRIINDRIV